jgi:hypothetical protein
MCNRMGLCAIKGRWEWRTLSRRIRSSRDLRSSSCSHAHIRIHTSANATHTWPAPLPYQRPPDIATTNIIYVHYVHGQ